MPKPKSDPKSSASSGTRKKQAAKKAAAAGGNAGAQPNPKGLSKAEKKKLKNAPKQKVYIPPPKPPQPVLPDPLDALGLGRTLPPELVVTLRRLGKKDAVTRRKALDELLQEWVVGLSKAEQQGEEAELERELKEQALVDAVPVWFYHLPSLLLSAPHRSITLQVHAALLSIPSVRSTLLNSLNLELLPGSHQVRDILGSWLTAALEEGKRGAGRAGYEGLAAWESWTSWDIPAEEAEASPEGKIDLASKLDSIVEYLAMAILTPLDLDDEIHPAPVAEMTIQAEKFQKNNKIAGKRPQGPQRSFTPRETETPESEEAVKAREVETVMKFRSTGLQGLGYILDRIPPDTKLPEALEKLLEDARLWALVHPTRMGGNEVESPLVRRAVWPLVSTLLKRHLEFVKTNIADVIGKTVLLSAFKEQEGSVWLGSNVTEALGGVLRHFKDVWLIGGEAGREVQATEIDAGAEEVDEEEDGDGDDDEDEDEEDGDEAEHDEGQSGPEDGQAVEKPSDGLTVGRRAYGDFLSFLQRGCNGNPLEGYPIVLLVIASIPPQILPMEQTPVQALLSSFWAPYYAKSLYTTPTAFGHSSIYAFLSGLMDSLALLANKTGKALTADGAEQAAFPSWLVEEYLRVWTEGIEPISAKAFRANRSLHGEKSTEPVQLAGIYGQNIRRLQNLDKASADELVDLTTKAIVAASKPDHPSTPSAGRPTYLGRVVYLVEVLDEGCGESCYTAEFDTSFVDLALCATDRLKEVLASSEACSKDSELDLSLVTRLMSQKGDCLSKSAPLAEGLSTLAQDLCRNLTELPANSAAAFVREYAAWKSDTNVWTVLSPIIASGILALDQTSPRGYELAQAFLVTEAIPGVKVDVEEDGLWQEVFLRACQVAIESGISSAMTLTQHGIDHSDGLITRETQDHILALISTALSSTSHGLLCGARDMINAKTENLVGLIKNYIGSHSEALLKSDIQRVVFVALHRLAFLEPLVDGYQGQENSASLAAWKSGVNAASSAVKEEVAALVFEDQLECLLDVAVQVHPYRICEVLRHGGLSPASNASGVIEKLLVILEQETDSWLRDSGRIPSSVDRLVPVPQQAQSSVQPLELDWAGRTKYGRVFEAIISILADDRSLLKASSTPLLYLVLVNRLLTEAAMADAPASGFWGRSLASTYTEELQAETDQLVSYAISTFTSEAEMQWHSAAMTVIASSKTSADAVQDVLRRLAELSSTVPLALRSFRDVLSRLLKSTGNVQVIERWAAWAQSVSDKNAALAQAVFAACTPLLSENARLDRIRNEVASRLTGVKFADANTSGAKYLRMLSALAPEADSVDSFLPQQRCIFLMRHLNDWLMSDDEEADELSEEVENRIIRLYVELCPIVQDVPGAHWDVMFDLLGSNLESMDLNDPDSYELSYSTLLLLVQVRDLALRNKALAALWTDRALHLGAVKTGLLGLNLETLMDIRLSSILDLSLDVIQSAGMASKTSPEDINKMYTLLGYPHHRLQRSLLQILRSATRQRTIELVVEVEAGDGQQMEEQDMPKIAPQVLSLIGLGDAEEGSLLTSPQAFAWTLLFDHFDGASAALRASYIEQLREMDVIEGHLIPLVIAGMREVLPSGNRAQDDARVSLDEFYVELFEPEDIFSANVLALHIFYRALFNTPVLVRNWLEACKDRQLTIFFRGMVLKHFSPTIIEKEFSILRTPEAIHKLEDENLTVKVVSGAPEVTVKYVIDEAPMEIALRLPPEFPLKAVEIKDLSRVGVSEQKWRGWLLNVQQLITSRPGLLLDALTLYKQNISAHFEGRVECAICYSIISTNDRQLPKKPCTTCKNLFHNSCLFQWFKSSNSSTCPMCRSLF